MAEETTHSQQSNYSWNCLTRSSGVWFIIICYTYYKCFKKPKEANFTVWTFYRRIVTCDTNEQYKLIPFSLKKKKKEVTSSPIWPDLILQCLCIFRIMWILQTVQYFFKKKKKKRETNWYHLFGSKKCTKKYHHHQWGGGFPHSKY